MGFRGLTVQGSNGSYPYLSTSERVELVERVREIIDENRHQNIEVHKQYYARTNIFPKGRRTSLINGRSRGRIDTSNSADVRKELFIILFN